MVDTIEGYEVPGPGFRKHRLVNPFRFEPLAPLAHSYPTNMVEWSWTERTVLEEC